MEKRTTRKSYNHGVLCELSLYCSVTSHENNLKLFGGTTMSEAWGNILRMAQEE